MRRIAVCGAVIAMILGARPGEAADPPSAGGRPDESPKPAAAPGPPADDPLRFGPVKLGLDVMSRGETATDFSLSGLAFTPGNDETRVLFRVRPSAEYGPAGWFRARLEGQWYAAYGERDVSELTVYQGFVEASPPGVKALVLKAGRQELVYGTTFMLGADAFFDGLSFDAAKVTVKPAESISVDAFAGQYVRRNSGGIEGKLYGVYGTYAPAKTASVDLYALRDKGGAGATHVGGAHERTDSIGARLCAKVAGRVDVEVEPVWQFGRKDAGGSAHEDIRAFGGHADVTIDPRIDRHPGKLFLSYAYGSGDGDPTDGMFREFHNPNNDTPLVGDMSVVADMAGLEAGGVAASGLRIVTAGGNVDVAEKLNVALNSHHFRANRVPPGVSRDIGVEANLVVTYRLAETVSILGSANRFFTGGFFRDAAGSGRDVGYYYVQVQAGL